MNLFSVFSGGQSNRDLCMCIRSLVIGSLFALVTLASAPALHAQRTPSHEDSLLYAAIDQIDAGEFTQARETLREGERLYPGNSSFPYELALILYQEKNYAEANRALQAIVDAPDATDRYYQLLGNSHDILGRPTKAISTYEDGLERFPNSGVLHAERGIMAYNVQNVPEAVGYWERGVARAPDFPANYFHLSRIYLETENPGWGLIYGEIFLNLEPNSNRSAMMREMLWTAWNAVINVNQSDGIPQQGEQSLGNIAIFEDVKVTVDSRTRQTLVPFEFFVQKSLSLAALPMMIMGSDTLTIALLHQVRTRFLENWYEDSVASRHFAVSLFEHQRELQEQELLETYDYLIFFNDQTEAEARAWFADRESKIDALNAWERLHPLDTDPSSAFTRVRLKGLESAETR